MSSINWLPIDGRLIVKRVTEYEGSLIVPASVKDSSMLCAVVSSCEDSTFVPGDKILIARYSGYNVPVLNREYNDCLIVNEEDILCTEAI